MQEPFGRLQRSNADMDHLVRALSHDMAANFMLLEHSFRRLKDQCSDEMRNDLRDSVAHVEACLAQSQRFLTDMSMLAKTGDVPTAPEQVDLSAVIRDALFEQDELLRERGVRLSYESNMGLVWCHPARVKQVVTNVLRNALLHGCDPADPILEICTLGCEIETDRPMTWLRIYDNGPGIDQAEQDAVFLPGRRLASRSDTGSGMGLAIVRRVVEQCGGEVFIDPTESRGTAVVFSLPTFIAQTEPAG